MGLDWYFKNVLEAQIARNGETEIDKSGNYVRLSLSADELKQYIKELQNNNPQAGALLCATYEPLIRSLVFKRRISQSLEEQDAYQIAFKAFWELVSTYQGEDFEHLPGLIKKAVSDALSRAIYKNSRITSNEDLIIDGEDAQELAGEDNYAAKLSELALAQGMAHLSQRQRAILEKRYFESETQQQVASSLKCSDRWIRKQENAALDALGGILS